jgi:hypothetical protein
MEFKSIIRQLIVEANETKLTFFYKNLVKPKEGKEKGILDFEIFKKLILSDPTTKKPRGYNGEGATYEDMVSDKVQPGKYSNWLLKNYVKPSNEELEQVGTSNPKSPDYAQTVRECRRRFIDEDLNLTIKLLQNFTVIKPYIDEDKRNIDKLTPHQIVDIINDLPQNIKDKIGYAEITQGDVKGSKDVKTRFTYPGSEIIHIGPKYAVIKIEQGYSDAKSKAATHFGGKQQVNQGESSWCTSVENSSNFRTYIADGPLYVILSTNLDGPLGAVTELPQDRYQFHFPSSQFMDRQNRQIKLVEFLNENDDLKDVFKSEFAAGLTKNKGTKVEINYPNSSAGKFIALYGFDELFKSLPKDIITLNVVNSSNETIALDLSESLGQFTKLETLTLTNMVKSIPDSIGNCKELDILTLNNNPNLESLPDSIMNLPLTFISLKGSSNNLILPDGFNEKFDEMTPGSKFYTVSDLDFSDNDDLKK